MELFGRKQIFTDELNIDATNILPVLSEAFTIHEMNRSEIQYLFEYARGKQPILKREKEVRPEINERIVDNMASEILLPLLLPDSRLFSSSGSSSVLPFPDPASF